MKTIFWFDFFVDADLFISEEETKPLWIGGSAPTIEICRQLGMNEDFDPVSLEMVGATIIDKIKEQIEWESYPWVEVKISRNRMRFVLGPGIVHEEDWVVVTNVFKQIMKMFNVPLLMQKRNESLDVFLKNQHISQS